MNTNFGRTLIVALLGLSLAAAVSVGLNARNNGVGAQAHFAGMQLQGRPDGDEVVAASDVDEGDARTAACTQRDCEAPEQPKQELALVQVGREFTSAKIDPPQPQEGKAFAALGDDIQPKSKD